MITSVINQNPDITYLSTILNNLDQLLKVKMYKSIDIKKDDIIRLAKYYMDQDKQKYKDSQISQDVGKILKLIKIKEKQEKKWEIDTINNLHNIVTDTLYSIQSIINGYTPISNFISTINEKYIKIKKIYGGIGQIFIITEDTTIFCQGYNTFGQLGLHIKSEEVTFLQNFTEKNKTISDNLKKISCGYAYTMFITNNGYVYSTGAVENGRIGIDSKENICIPKLINIENVIDVQCGSTMSVFLTSNFEIYCCGQKYYNGISTDDIFIPTKVNIPEKIISISIGNGGYHTVVLTFDGEIYTWGHNRVCQLGISNEQIFDTIDESKYCYLRSDNETIKNEKGLTIIIKPIKINLPFIVKKISTGWGHTLLLSFDNKVYCCGRGNEGQLGIPTSQLKYKCGKQKDGDRYYINEFTEIPFFKKKTVLDILTSKCTNVIKTTEGIYMFGEDCEGISLILNDTNIDNVKLCEMVDVTIFSIIKN